MADNGTGGGPAGPSGTEPPGRAALVAAGDLIKYTLVFATGALVFSAGLVSENINLPQLAKFFLLGAWCLLAASIFAGVLALSRIPQMLAEENYSLEDRYLTYAYRAFQPLFLLGVACLTVVLALALFSKGGETIEPKPTTDNIPRGESTASHVNDQDTSP